MTSLRKRFWPLIWLAFLPLIPLWRAVFDNQAIGPFDQIRQFAPWNGPAPLRPWDVLQADGVLQFFGWRDLVFSAWGQGQLPLWNPYALAGTPLLANSQSAALYPPHILLGLLHVPTGLAMLLLAWGHLSWAGVGTYLLVRRLGGSRLGGALAGSSFLLSPFMLAWTALPSVITTVAWIPWVLVGVAAIFGRRPLKGDPEDSDPADESPRRTFGTVAGLALCVAMLCLSGHLQFLAYGLVAAVLFAAGLSVVPSPGGAGGRRLVGSWMQIGLACVLGALLAAPQLLPVLAYSQFSHRRVPPTAEGYRAYLGHALPLYELGTLPFAPLVGEPFDFVDESQSDPNVNAKLPSAFFPQFVNPGDNYAESAVSVGLLVLSLVILAPWKRGWRRLLPAALVGLVALLLAIGTPLNAALYYGVPGWSATGSPGRIIVLFVLSACVLAGLAIGDLPALPASGLRRLVPLLVPFALGAVGIVLVWSCPLPQPSPASFVRDAIQGAAPGLLVAGVVTAIVLAMAYHLENPSSRVAVLAAPVVLAVLAGALRLIPTGDPSFLASSPLRFNDPNARVAIVNQPWDLAVAAPALYPPNTPSIARIHDLSGYDSLLHRDTVALLRDIDGRDPAASANGNMMFVKPTADPAKLADAGVSEVWSRAEMPQLGEAASVESGVYRYELKGPGRASTPAGPATIKRETPSQITVEAQGPGRLVLRDRNMPGWIAKVDGRHAPILGTTWREVDLAAGEHTVEFNYVPPEFRKGCLLAALGLAGVICLAVVGRRKTTEV